MSDYWIQTYTGKRFDLLEPRQEDIDDNDIAHALSMLCRFTGHTKFFYSVAEHSYNVSTLVENFVRRVGGSAKDAAHAGLEALLHDAAEAYVGDMSRPLKQLVASAEVPLGSDGFTSYKMLEERIAELIFKVAGIEDRNHELVKRVDNHMLAVEARQVLDGGPRHGWVDPALPRVPLSLDPDFAVPHLVFMAPETVRRMFVMRAAELSAVIAGLE